MQVSDKDRTELPRQILLDTRKKKKKNSTSIWGNAAIFIPLTIRPDAVVWRRMCSRTISKTPSLQTHQYRLTVPVTNRIGSSTIIVHIVVR